MVIKDKMSASTFNTSFVDPIDGELVLIQLSNKVLDLDPNLIKFLDLCSLGQDIILVFLLMVMIQIESNSGPRKSLINGFTSTVFIELMRLSS